MKSLILCCQNLWHHRDDCQQKEDVKSSSGTKNGINLRQSDFTDTKLSSDNWHTRPSEETVASENLKQLKILDYWLTFHILHSKLNTEGKNPPPTCPLVLKSKDAGGSRFYFDRFFFTGACVSGRYGPAAHWSERNQYHRIHQRKQKLDAGKEQRSPPKRVDQ